MESDFVYSVADRIIVFFGLLLSLSTLFFWLVGVYTSFMWAVRFCKRIRDNT